MKIYLESNGCLSRSLDLKRLEAYFKANKCQIVKKASEADKVVFLGCAAVKKEEEWSVQIVRGLKQQSSQIILGGCVRDMSGQRFPELKQFDSISTHSIEEIEQYFPQFKIKMGEIADANEGAKRNLGHYLFTDFLNLKNFRLCYIRKLQQYYLTRLKQRFVLRIAGGCAEHCSFCTIRKAIGPIKSKSIADCLKELKIAQSKKIYRINLLADDSGSWGQDIGLNITDLLKSLAQSFPQAQFIIEELNPKRLIQFQDYFYELAKEGKLISLHIPIQSGAERILKMMGREVFVEKVIETCRHLKLNDPKLKLYTDLIIGFPTEQNEDFDKTLEVIKNAGFDSLSFYEYDDKNSLNRLGEVSKSIVRMRIKKLTSFLWSQKIGGGPF